MNRKAKGIIAAMVSAAAGTAAFYGTCILFPMLYNMLGFTGFTISVTLVSFAVSVIYYVIELYLEKKNILGKYIFPVCTVLLPFVLSFIIEGITLLQADGMFNGTYVPLFLFFSQLGYVFMLVFRAFYQIILRLGAARDKSEGKK